MPFEGGYMSCIENLGDIRGLLFSVLFIHFLIVDIATLNIFYYW